MFLPHSSHLQGPRLISEPRCDHLRDCSGSISSSETENGQKSSLLKFWIFRITENCLVDSAASPDVFLLKLHAR